MTGVVILLCTCGSEEEAQRIGTALIEERLAACVNLLPSVFSIYRWEGVIEKASEVLLLVKSTEEHFDSLRDRITELHSYDTPEIISLPVSNGSEKYLEWIREETRTGA